MPELLRGSILILRSEGHEIDFSWRSIERSLTIICKQWRHVACLQWWLWYVTNKCRLNKSVDDKNVASWEIRRKKPISWTNLTSWYTFMVFNDSLFPQTEIGPMLSCYWFEVICCREEMCVDKVEFIIKFLSYLLA